MLLMGFFITLSTYIFGGFTMKRSFVKVIADSQNLIYYITRNVVEFGKKVWMYTNE